MAMDSSFMACSSNYVRIAEIFLIKYDLDEIRNGHLKDAHFF